MAIETKKIIEISTAGAVSSVKELKDEINSLRDAWLNAEEGTEEYDEITERLIEDQKKLNDVMRVGKNEASAATGSYNSLVNQMNALKTAWRSTTSEITRAQLGDKIREINDQLKDYDASIGNHQCKVGSYEEALRALTATYDSQKQELAALKTALDNLEPGTDAYNEAFERATEITHNLQERQQQLRMSANDLGTQLSNVASMGAGLVGAFNSINAIMALTGSKNEELQKTMVKLQAGIALVQGLKGIEGAIKSMKAYAQWAAKAYDSIVKWISGSKSQQKQIQATTNATNINTAANTANATSENAVAVGATTMSAGMKGAAASTTVATGAMVAFKAVLMSLGIGLIVAAISGLITVLGKLAGKSKEAYNAMATNAQNLIDIETEISGRVDQAMEHQWELEKARGEDELKLAKEKYDYYEKRLTRYTDLIGAANELRYKLSDFKGSKTKSSISNLELPELQILGKNLVQVEKELEKMEANGNLAFKKLSAGAIEEFDKIKEKGIKTFGDIYTVVDLYGEAMKEEKTAYEIDPLSGLETDFKAQAEGYIKEAKDAVKSEIQLENDSYNQRKALLEKYGYDTTALTRAHNKKVYEMVTAATQSIIDTAHAANQTELQNLTEKYEKEKKILKQYGKDTTELTLAYEKQKAQIIYNEEVKAVENAIKELDRFASESGPMKQKYDQLEAMGVAYAKDLAKAQEEEYQKMKFSLEKQFEYWNNLWEKYKDDEKLTQDQRLALQEKYLNAKNALEKSETDYLLKQIKVRKQALEEEIAEIEKAYDAATKKMASENYNQDKTKNLGQYIWKGGTENQSFNRQRDVENQSYELELERLQVEADRYHEISLDLSRTDAERTAAHEKEVQKRMEIDELGTAHMQKMDSIQEKEYAELISTITDVGNSIADVFGSIYDTIKSTLDYQVKAGKISQDEADKQLERYRWLQYTQAIISTLAGSLGAFTQASATIPPPYGQIVGAAAAAAVLAQGVAQIAAIKAASKDSTLGGAAQMSATVTPTVSDFQPEYVSNMTGRDDTEYLNELFSKQKLFVSVTDINSTQARVKTTEQESSF